MASGTASGLILISSVGPSDPYYNEKSDVNPKDGYTKAKCNGDRSCFVVYDQKDFGEDSKSLIVDDKNEKDMGSSILSFQGYDKEGIILFTHHNYCGKAELYTTDKADISDQFPPGVKPGVSSLVVYKYTWELYTEPNYRGPKISIDGKTSFGPGSRIPFVGGSANDKAMSIKIL